MTAFFEFLFERIMLDAFVFLTAFFVNQSRGFWRGEHELLSCPVRARPGDFLTKGRLRLASRSRHRFVQIGIMNSQQYTCIPQMGTRQCMPALADQPPMEFCRCPRPTSLSVGIIERKFLPVVGGHRIAVLRHFNPTLKKKSEAVRFAQPLNESIHSHS